MCQPIFTSIQKWARAFRQSSFHAAVKTNNGLEAQNKVLKYSYLPHGRNINLSHLADILINSFLPDSYEKYIFQNYKMNPAYRSYSEQVPEYLHGRPPALVEHCLNRLKKAKRKFNAESLITCDAVNGLFSITGESSVYHIDFGVASGQPSCTCGDWSKTHFPCKDFFAVFLYKPDWDWNSLPKSYLNSAYMCADTSALAQASMLISCTSESGSSVDIVPSDQTSQAVEVPDDQASQGVEVRVDQPSQDVVQKNQTSQCGTVLHDTNDEHQVQDETCVSQQVVSDLKK